jgi:hypothetical protein
MDMMPVKPERKAQLEDFAQKHGRDPATVLDHALEVYLADARDYDETVQDALEGYEDVKAGRTQPLEEFFEDLRVEHGFPRWTDPQGKTGLRNILAWLLSQKAGENGLRWFKGIYAAIASLSELPARCPLARESAALPFDMHQLLYGSKRYRFRILYMIEGETVFILRVRRGSRKDLLQH